MAKPACAAVWSPNRAMLANALFGGALAGIGKAFQQAATTTTTSGLGTTQVVDPTQVARSALGGGVGTAGNLLAEYYLKAADKLFPVLETDGGRVIELLITKGVPYPAKTTPSTRPLLSREAHRPPQERQMMSKQTFLGASITC